MSKKCPRCGSKDIHITEYPAPTDNMATCYGCGYADLADRFPEHILFDAIAESPEVLAPYFVFLKGVLVTNINPKQQWISTLTGEVYPARAEAITATVAKLKDVAVCTTKSLIKSDTNLHLQAENERLKNALQKIVDLRMLNPNLKESAHPSSCSEDMFVNFYCKMGDIAVKALTNDTNNP